MAASTEIREFLASRRARITPEQAGLRAHGGRRRVPGLRREEVALLAGISVEYYTHLERGNVRGVSEDVLDASPAPCNSTRSKGPISSTSSALPSSAPAAAKPPFNGSGPASSASSTP